MLNHQKTNYVRNASVEELAQYVSEPNLKVNHLDATVGDYFSTNYLPGVVNQPGDIGTQKTSVINLERQSKRFLFNEKIAGPHEGRFELMKTKLTSQSHHRKGNEVQFDKMSKRMDIFEVNQAGIRNRDNARRKRPPSGLIVDYDNATTKDRTLPKKDRIVPNFGKMQPKVAFQGKSPEYYGALQLDSQGSKDKVKRRSVQQIPYSKTRGREDNLMYNISEGYNLETNDKTFWDVNNIYDIVMQRKAGRSPTSSIWSEQGNQRSTMNKSALAILETVKGSAEPPVYDHANLPQFGAYTDIA